MRESNGRYPVPNIVVNGGSKKSVKKNFDDIWPRYFVQN